MPRNHFSMVNTGIFILKCHIVLFFQIDVSREKFKKKTLGKPGGNIILIIN